MPTCINENPNIQRDSALAMGSFRSRFFLASFLVGLVITCFVFAGMKGLLEPAAVRLLVLLFAGQWLFSAFDHLRGKTSLFIERAYFACSAVGVLAQSFYESLRHKKIYKIALRHEERVGLLFWIVKLIFIPFLLGVASNQANHLVPVIMSGKLPELLTSFSMFYVLWLGFIDLLDTAVATLGYAVESKTLNNQVRSVDTSIIGWLAVLCCYPPCWVITSALIPINASPFISTPINTFFDVVVRILLLVFLTLFTVSTLNLNVHFSNLCHRGLVSSGLYSVVRHPAYSCKLISWALVLGYLCASNLTMWFHFLCWVAIYVLRAITEERHLSRVDSDYTEYCKRVKYRFIPGLV